MSVLADIEAVIPGIKKVGPNNWEFRANKPGSGGQQTRRRGYPTQQAAYTARNLYLGNPELKVTGANLNCGEWLDRWLVQVQETRRETTYSGYRKSVERDIKPMCNDLPLIELTSEHVRNVYREMVKKGYATATIDATARRFRTALYAAMNETPALITANPARGVIPPKGNPPRVRRVWTFTDLRNFASFVSNERDAAMWAFWMTTGIRRGELCGLFWDRISFENAEVVIDWQRTKTIEGKVVEGLVKTDAGERRVPLVPQVSAALKTWRADQASVRLAKGERWRAGDRVFTTFRGTSYFPDSLNDRLEKIIKKTGLPRISPHELRHTYATRALENGMDVKILSKMLGHSRVETTMNLYMHPSTDQLKAAQTALSDRMFG
jgi:integrase